MIILIKPGDLEVDFAIAAESIEELKELVDAACRIEAARIPREREFFDAHRDAVLKMIDEADSSAGWHELKAVEPEWVRWLMFVGPPGAVFGGL
jgi:hypothetical protein